MGRRVNPDQLGFAFPEPVLWAAPVNAAARVVLDALKTSFPAFVSLEGLYREIVDARFEKRRHPVSDARCEQAVVDFVLFDGATATCVVCATPPDWLSIRWENCSGMWGWDDKRACWKRYAPH